MFLRYARIVDMKHISIACLENKLIKISDFFCTVQDVIASYAANLKMEPRMFTLHGKLNSTSMPTLKMFRRVL